MSPVFFWLKKWPSNVASINKTWFLVLNIKKKCIHVIILLIYDLFLHLDVSERLQNVTVTVGLTESSVNTTCGFFAGPGTLSQLVVLVNGEIRNGLHLDRSSHTLRSGRDRLLKPKDYNKQIFCCWITFIMYICTHDWGLFWYTAKIFVLKKK